MSEIPFFSIVTVCLNAGNNLLLTASTVLGQSFQNCEYIVKDGMSTDGSLGRPPSDPRMRLVTSPDRGIYDAMNQALSDCRGFYVNFLNAGDRFYNVDILDKVYAFARQHDYPDIIYTDYYSEGLQYVITYPERLSPFYLYRRFVNHQAQFIRRGVFEDLHLFDTDFCVIADVEFLVRALQQHGYRAMHCPIVSVFYDGGYSENPNNRKQFNWEIQEIRRRYFGRWRWLYEFIRLCTFPEARMWFLRRCDNQRVRHLYCRVANLFR